MSHEELLTQSGTLQRAAVTRDAATGDEVELWTTIETGVRCLARTLSARSEVPLGLLEQVTNIIHVKFRTDVNTGRWRMLIDGAEFRIVDAYDPGNRHHHLELWARRMNA